jgi:hypothetical protein
VNGGPNRLDSVRDDVLRPTEVQISQSRTQKTLKNGANEIFQETPLFVLQILHNKLHDLEISSLPYNLKILLFQIPPFNKTFPHSLFLVFYSCALSFPRSTFLLLDLAL